MRKILVTGGAGFIGSHVAKELIKMGKKVIVLDDLSGGFEKNVPKECEFVQGSINDTSLLDDLFDKNYISHIYHLAAYAAEGLSHFIRNFNYNNNLIGSINLVNRAVLHEIECFVFTSSIAVYGSNQLPFTEETIPLPEDPYGISKYAVELDLKAAHEMFGLDYIIFRPHNVYGERQNIGDKYRNVIGIFMNHIMQNKAMPVFGNGTQTRAFSYVSDVAVSIAHSGFMPKAYNEVFNIGADQFFSISEVAQKVAASMGVQPKIQYLDARNEVQHAYSSHEKTKTFFNEFVKQIPLDEGLGRMAKWAMDIGIKESKKFEDIEISKSLPQSWK